MKNTLAFVAAISLATTSANAELLNDPSAEERAEKIVRMVTAFTAENSELMAVIAAHEVKVELRNITGVRADGRLLIFDYVAKSDNQTYRAAVDAADVLILKEGPEEAE